MKTIIRHLNPDGSGTGNWSETEGDAAERIRLYVKAGKLGTALAILRYGPEARARIQSRIQAERRHRGWGHA